MKPPSLIALCALQVAALAVPDTHVEHERRDLEQNFVYEKRSRLHHMVLPVRIGLVSAHPLDPVDVLMETADESSPNYGRRYHADEIEELFAPARETVQAVRNWLVAANISEEKVKHSYNQQWMEFDTTTSELENLLHTEYWVYEHPETGKAAVGCDKYHVPRHVQSHVDYITPGVTTLKYRDERSESMLKKRMLGKSTPLMRPMPFPVEDTIGDKPKKPCSAAITPRCIRCGIVLYNITDATLVKKGNSLGIYENGDFLKQNDMNLFFKHYFPKAPQGTFPKFKGVDGAPVLPNKDVGYSDVESVIDFQLAYPLVYPNEIDLFQVDDLYYEYYGFGYGSYGLFNTFMDALDKKYCTYKKFGQKGDDKKQDPKYPDTHKGKVAGYANSHWRHPHQCGVYKPPGVISISYSWDEAAYSRQYLKRQCSEFAKLGMQGTTIVVSSGDEGVSGKGIGCLGPKNKAFAPLAPSNCPAVVSTGSTVLPKGSVAGKDPERAPTGSEFYNGGGFANYYKTPPWQMDMVKNYFKNHNPGYKTYNISAGQKVGDGGGIYNRGGRGYPDISAVGFNIANYASGAPFLGGGTSASAPIIASLIARINAYRLDAGKDTIGYVNPIIYKHPEVFNDIRVGHNAGCGTKGFSCVPGWDPVTGMGTPIYPKFKKLLMNHG